MYGHFDDLEFLKKEVTKFIKSNVPLDAPKNFTSLTIINDFCIQSRQVKTDLYTFCNRTVELTMPLFQSSPLVLKRKDVCRFQKGI